MVVVTGFSVVVGSVLHEPYKELKLGKIPQSHLLFFFPRTLHEPYKELKPYGLFALKKTFLLNTWIA